MMPAGWVRVDCHLHTVASGDSVLTVEELADRARQAALGVVCVTDHNVTHAAVAAAERDLGVRVIVGEEVRTPDGDVIGLFLTERIPYVLPLAEVIGLIRGQGGLVYVPHPFDQGRSSVGRVLPGLCAAGSVDVIEVFNAKIADQALNEKAARLAERFGLPGGAGSDAHDAPGVGAAYLEMPDFDGPASFLRRAGGGQGDRRVPRPRASLPAATALAAVAGGGCRLVSTPGAQVNVRRGPRASGPRPNRTGCPAPGRSRWRWGASGPRRQGPRRQW